MPDQENILLDHSASPDLIHNFVQTKSDAGGLNVDHINQTLDNPQTPSHTLSHLLDARIAPVQESGRRKVHHSSQAQSIFGHPNMTAQIAEGFFGGDFAETWSSREAVKAAVKVPNVSQEALYNKAKDHITGGVLLVDNLKPEYIQKLLDEHTDLTPGTDSYHKLHELVASNLSNTPHHDETSLNSAVDHLINPPVATGHRIEGHDDYLREFVAHNKELTSDHLNKINSNLPEWFDSRDKQDVLKEVLGHSNVDPTMLAEFANKALDSANHYSFHSEPSASALRNPKLPEESRKAVLGKLLEVEPNLLMRSYETPYNVAKELAKNPNTTTEEVGALYQKGWKGAFNSDKMDQGVLEQEWEASDKKADATKKFLGAPNLPTSVLKDVVGKNKNIRLAIQALGHNNVDDEVIQVGLGRRAKKMQEAIVRHPLVSEQVIPSRIKDGKLSPLAIFHDHVVSQSVGKMSPEIRNDLMTFVHGQTKGMNLEEISAATKISRNEDIVTLKATIADSDWATPEIRAEQKKDLITHMADLSSDTLPHAANQKVTHFVNGYATRGDLDAQAAMMNNNNFIRRANLSELNYSPENLSKIADRLMASENLFPIEQDTDSEEYIQKNKAGQLKRLLSNPNLSTDTFNNIVVNPTFLSDPSQYIKSRHYRSDKVSTLFDDHLKDKTSEEKQAFFQNLMSAHEPYSNVAVLASLSASDQLKQQAWDKIEVAGDQAVAETYSKLGPTALSRREKSKILAGGLAVPEIPTTDKNKIIADLKSDSNEDKQIVSGWFDFVKDIPDEGLGDEGHIGSDHIEQIPLDFFKGDEGLQLVEKMKDSAAIQHSFPTLAMRYVAANTEDMVQPGSLFINYSKTTPEAIGKFSNLLDSWTLPHLDEDRDTTTDKWSAVFNNGNNTALRFLERTPKDAAGNAQSTVFDSVVDSLDSDHPDYVDVLKNLVKFKLISSGKKEEMGQDLSLTPLFLDSTTSKEEKKGLIWRFFGSSEPQSSDLIQETFKHFHSGVFGVGNVRSYGAYTPEDDEKEMMKANISQMVDAVGRANYDPENAAEDLNKAFKSGVLNDSSVRYHQNTKNDMLRTFIKSVKESGLAPVAQNETLVSMLDSVNPSKIGGRRYSGGSDLMYKTISKDLVKQAVAGEDIDMTIRLFKKKINDPQLNAKMEGYLSDPDRTPSENLWEFGDLIMGDSLQPEQSHSVLNAMTSRLYQKQQAEDPDYPDFLDKYSWANYKISIKSFVGDELSTKAAHSIFDLAGMAPDEETAKNINDRIQSVLINGASFDPAKGREAFINLPNESEGFATTPKSIDFSTEFFNHRDIVQNSTDGWKLTAMMHNSENLKKEFNDVIVNRVLDGGDLGVHEDSTTQFIDKTIRAGNAQPETVGKLLRTRSDEAVFNIFHEIADGYDANETPNTHIMAEEYANRLDSVARSDLLEQNPAKWISDVHNFTNATAQCFSTDSDTVESEQKLNAVHHSIEKTLGWMNDHWGRLTASILESSESDIHEATDSITSLYTRLTHGLPVGYQYASSQQSMGVLNNLSKVADFMEAASQKINYGEHGQYVEGETKGRFMSHNVPEYLDGWMRTSPEMKTEDWKQAFNVFPETYYIVPSRPSVDSELLSAFNFDLLISRIDNSGQLNKFFESTRALAPKLTDDAKEKYTKSLIDNVMKAQNINTDWKPDNDQRGGSTFYTALEATLADLVSHAPDHVGMDTLNNIEDVLTRQAKTAGSFRVAAVSAGAGGLPYSRKAISNEMGEIESQFKPQNDISSMPPNPKEVHRELGKMLQTKHWDNDLIESVSSHIQNYGIYTLGSDMVDMTCKNPFAPERIRGEMAATVFDADSLYGSSPNDVIKEHYNESKYTIEDSKNNLIADGYLPKKFFDGALAKQKAGKFDDFEYFAPRGLFPTALANPAHGGEAFRAMPPAIDSRVKNVDPSKFITSVKEETKQTGQLNQLLQAIPAEGITWPVFKKQFNKLANFPPVQKVFQTKGKGGNKPIFPEHVVEAIKEHQENLKDFHVSYTHWDNHHGWAQKHNKNENPYQLTVQVNWSEYMENELKEDPRLWELARKLGMSGNQVDPEEGQIGQHPTNPFAISWARVDTTPGKDGWILEEIQSDFEKNFRKTIMDYINKGASKIKLAGQPVSKEELESMAKKIAKVNSGFVQANYKAVEENARRHGVTKLYMHGVGIRAGMSGKKGDSIPKGWYQIYEDMPPKLGFKQISYNDYPNATNEGRQYIEASGIDDADVCWVKDLTKEEK